MPIKVPSASRRASPPTGRAPEGIITAIVAVTGVRDQVEDIILPGAFTATLRRRRPKVVGHHLWTAPVARILHIEEWRPGDSRLPKRLKDGRPWPAAAGALVATMQFALDTEAGHETFKTAAFYSGSQECEWSIGYKVPPGKASRTSDGVRLIRELDLFEVSFVLFGAADQTMTLEVKALEGGMERKRGPQTGPAADAVLEAKSMWEQKMQPMTGSYEQRREALVKAVRTLLGGDGSAFISVEATYDDHVIVTAERESGTQSWSVPYTWKATEVALGEPEPVTLSLVAAPDSPDTAAPSNADGIRERFLVPTAAALEEAAAMVALSGAEAPQLEALRPALDSLHGVLERKGLNPHDPPLDEDDDGLEEFTDADDWHEDFDASDGDPEDGDDDEESEAGEARVKVDPEQVRAELAALRK